MSEEAAAIERASAANARFAKLKLTDRIEVEMRHEQVVFHRVRVGPPVEANVSIEAVEAQLTQKEQGNR